MPMVKARLKLIPILLISAILCAGCDIPDLSEFTKQSAEMTRGIRTGVKDTEGVIKAASERSDLYSDTTRAKLKKDLKTYQQAIKPTVEALDALDGYLEALNALSQANKKSEENSRAAVNAVTNLVTAVSGLTFASSAVNVATGLVTLAEQFRTTRDFKKRVNLAAEIVEGRFKEKVDSAGNVVTDAKGRAILVKACTGKAEDQITESSGTIKSLVAGAMERAPALTDVQLKDLQGLSPEEKREKLKEWGKISDAEYIQIRTAEAQISSFGCGVIDLIKFNVSDLKKINQDVSKSMYDNIKDITGPVLAAHESIRTRRDNIREEVGRILAVKNLVSRINELVVNNVDPNLIIRRQMRLKEDLDDLFARDAVLKNEVLDSITECGASCGRMLEALNLVLPANCDNAECMKGLRSILNGVNGAQFARSVGIIISVVDAIKDRRVSEDQKLAADVERLKPDYDAVVADLTRVSDKRDQLDSLLTTSLTALKAWADAHANLRVAVNTKKPLTVSKLTSEVREIWDIIQPKAN